MAYLPLSSSVIVLASLFTSAWVFICLYRISLHRLARIPGPKIYAISVLPYTYHLICGSWPRTLKCLHDEYGPVLRIAPNDVSFIGPGAWKTIYGHKTNALETFEKDLRMYRKTLSGSSNIIIADREDHKRMRRLMSHAFSEKALRNQGKVLEKYTNILLRRLGELAQQGAVVDIMRWYNFTTFDLVGDLAFGEPFGCLEDGKYHPWVSLIFNSVRVGVYSQVARRIRILSPVMGLLIPKDLVRSNREHWQLSQATALRRINSNDKEREDFMSYILRHNDEKGMNVNEIVENANTLILAGSETTATILSGTTFHLLMNPEAYKKLVQEIRSTFQSRDDITMVSVNNLRYLLAVFDEGFRMCKQKIPHSLYSMERKLISNSPKDPPVPVGLSRVTPQGGQIIEGHYMPEGTVVAVPQWASYQSKHNFRKPHKFIPERWLGDPEFEDDNLEVVNPFSYGPRNCIGKNLAYAEMRLLLASLLWEFDLEIMSESKGWAQQDVFTLWSKGALNVKLKPVRSTVD